MVNLNAENRDIWYSTTPYLGDSAVLLLPSQVPGGSAPSADAS